MKEMFKKKDKKTLRKRKMAVMIKMIGTHLIAPQPTLTWDLKNMNLFVMQVVMIFLQFLPFLK